MAPYVATYTNLSKDDWKNFLKITNPRGTRIEGALCRDCRHMITTVSKRRLAGHRKSCPAKTTANYCADETDSENINRDVVKLRDILDQDLAKFFYSASIPFRQVENTHLRRFIKRVQTLNVEYEPPSRKSLGGTILEKVHDQVLAKKKILLNGNNAVLLVDGWRNKSSNRKYLVFSVRTTNAPQTYLTFFDTSIEKETAENLRDRIDEAIKIARDDYNCNVYAIISDNDSKIVAGAKLAKGKSLIRTSCSSHSGNLLIKLFVTAELLDLIRDILTIFRDPKLESLLLSKGGSKLKNYPDTRFCYLRDTCDSILNNLKYLKELTTVDDLALSATVKNKLLGVEFKNQLTSVVQNMDPICTLINKCQDPKSNVADAAQMWLALRLPTNDFDDHIKARIQKAVHPVGYAANLLHPRFRGRLMNAEQMNMAIVFLNGYLSHEAKLELEQYLSNDESYKHYADTVSDPISFWFYLKNVYIFQHLADAAIKLLVIPASTASLEGLFSNWTYVHNLYRNRLGHLKSSYLLDIYYSLKNDLYNEDLINDLMLIEDD